ncbi:MAG TPA: hypothetical protein VGR57_03400, partial [Ktedonobacterales bacterium]|nr:hypothetical protein [Ktedonobacterales bacterium]
PHPGHAPAPPAGRRHLARPPARSPRRRAVVLALLVGAVLIMSVAYAGVTIASEALRPAAGPGAPTVRVVIQPGETTAQIATELQRRGLIRNALLFRLWANRQGLDRSLRAGCTSSPPA